MSRLGSEGAECLIVTGMPAAGKSTVTRLIAAGLDRSARLDGDDLVRMIINGGVWALGEPADEAARQVELCNRNLCTLARNFVGAGFTTVIDWVIPDRRQLDLFRELLDPVLTSFVVLAPGGDACRERNRHRDPQQRWEFTGYDELGASMRVELGDHGWWLDSAELTAADTASMIINEAPSRARLG
ncbi:AAA family ATPase [Microlunatus sp. GCM10028923]|uniref:AAA family ATPase n=1 Tax=Microlunatus sp. GCM10028923 TaxID=3273400 RepID=UPI00360CDE21